MDSICFDPHHVARFKQWVSDAQKIAIVAHVNADGDAVGSLLGLHHLLQRRATPILPNGCPDNFRWLPDADDILSADDHLQQCQDGLRNADLIIGVDFNVPSRIGSLASSLADSSAHKVLIDHHHEPDNASFDITFSIPDLSSACEMVFWLALQSWGDDAIDYNVARCLYTGICTDTGSFSYSCEQPTLYHAAAALVRRNINAAEIHNNINNTFTINRLKFYGFAISQRLRIFPEHRFAYFYLSLADQEAFGINPSDMEGLVNYTLNMRLVDVGVLIREERDCVKLSFRSKNGIVVNTIAKDYFGGGGHTQAAGATTSLSFDDAIATIEKIYHISSK